MGSLDSGIVAADLPRRRLGQVFRYLQELNLVRNPVIQEVRQQLSGFWLRALPEHPSIRIGSYTPGTGDDEQNAGTDFVLQVRRPQVTPPPDPPKPIREWLKPGWDKPATAVETYPSRNMPGRQGQTRLVRFADDPRRSIALKGWREKRDEWARNEVPAREALRAFERIYAIYGEVQREEERVELVLGDGILCWDREEGRIHHPVLLQRLHLEFDPEVPEFTFRETDQAVELYSALFRSLPEVNGRQLAKVQNELEVGDYHPLDQEATAGFLRRLIQGLFVDGEYVETGEPQGSQPHPRLGRAPMIFLRRRTLGFQTALEAILRDLQETDELPQALLRLVGFELPLEIPLESYGDTLLGNEDEAVLLSKPANREQVEIARRLERHGCVLVQGPPGTGKSHTIANLLGHLLAQGKSVLVTAHTTKALRVLHEQVVPTLRPLCVSVLDRDSRDQLERSVNGIVKRASSDADKLEAEGEVYARERAHLLERLKQGRQRLLEARQDEYRELTVGGKAYSPAAAARKVAEGVGKDDWIPGPLLPGTVLPLSEGEVLDLYRTNATVSYEDERELEAALPPSMELPSPAEFRHMLKERARLVETAKLLREELWEPEGSGRRQPERLETLCQNLSQALAPLREEVPWRLAAIRAGRTGGALLDVWEELLAQVEAVAEEANQAERTFIQFDPVLAPGIPVEEQERILAEILAHLGGGGRLGLFTRLIHRRWWELTSSLRVNGECPQAKDHFEALLTRARLIRKRQELTNRWDRLLGVLGAPCSADLGPRPERRCLQFVSHVSLCLRWHEGVWAPIEAELKQAGFRWSAYLEAFPANLTDYGELIRLRQAAESLPIVLAAKIDHLRWLELEKALGDIVNRLSVCLGNGDSAEVVRDLKQAVSGLDPTRYQQGYERLVDLERRQGELSLRRELLRRLETAAPAWAGAIRNRLRGHDGSIPPGEAQAAWLWRQLHEELEQRAATSIEALQRELEDLSSKLLETTSEVVDRRAWAKVCRMPLPQRQALMGWLKIVQKIGAGTGKRVPVLIREARRCMERARSGVPVWIMPLSRVVENFDPSQTRFDVVIIDEASQSDVMALIAMYMAKEVVIVGDDKQVSPEAIGQQVIQVEQLIEMHLRGIPNRKLYDGRTSVYDLAMTSFGGIISLREHFRCVPDIIQFSNYLWYGGDIVPLRDPSRVAPRPHVVPYAAGGVSDQKVNREEALAIASLIAAAFQQPAYQLNERGQPVSLGIISLVGEEQAREIERLLRRHLEPGELERRRVLCGSAAQFQGDERDVVFLSLVDSSPEKPPLPIRRDERFQKRFNVAASRARDQLWVVYSVNPEVDLQPGDLRRGLIEHALNPAAFTGSLREKELRAESEFERLVLRHLVTANYRVTPQWSVGPLRIDLVVEGGGKRLAIECDGDRFHPPEKLAEDMTRQAILERLGWKFVRIRGSIFFRDPERAMKGVFRRLEEEGILPEAHLEQPPQGRSKEGQELLSLIRRRAQEIRLGWEHQETAGAD